MFSPTTEFEERETGGSSMDNVFIGQHNYMAISSSSSSVQHQRQSSFDLNSNNNIIRSLRGKGNAPFFNNKTLERKSSDSKMLTFFSFIFSIIVTFNSSLRI